MESLRSASGLLSMGAAAATAGSFLYHQNEIKDLKSQFEDLKSEVIKGFQKQLALSDEKLNMLRREVENLKKTNKTLKKGKKTVIPEKKVKPKSSSDEDSDSSSSSGDDMRHNIPTKIERLHHQNSEDELEMAVSALKRR